MTKKPRTFRFTIYGMADDLNGKWITLQEHELLLKEQK